MLGRINVELPVLAGVAGVICLASVIQSSIGFAYALFSTPILLWLGVPLPETIATIAICSFVQALFGVRHLKASVPWKWSGLAIVVRVAMMLVGLLALRTIVGLDRDIIRMAVGAILCILVVLQIYGRPRPMGRLHWLWGILAFGTSGFLMGICGMGGPPLIIWSLAQCWPSEKTRAFLFTVFAATIPIQVGFLYLAFGPVILKTTAIALLFTPVVYLGALIGLPLGNKLDKDTLSKIVHAVLFLLGLSSVLTALLF